MVQRKPAAVAAHAGLSRRFAQQQPVWSIENLRKCPDSTLKLKVCLQCAAPEACRSLSCVSDAALSRTDERTMLLIRMHQSLPHARQKQYVPRHSVAALSQQTHSVATTLTPSVSTTRGSATALCITGKSQRVGNDYPTRCLSSNHRRPAPPGDRGPQPPANFRPFPSLERGPPEA